MKAVFYTDGSCRPNPGYGGFGYYGYTYKDGNKAVSKHPYKPIHFSSQGVNKERVPDEKIEVLDIYEYIDYVDDQTTNNSCELASMIAVLRLADKLEELEEILIWSDSNYIATSIDNIETWIKNNWKRQDGKPLVHRRDWETIKELLDSLKNKNVKIDIQWVKAHNGTYGNEMADMYSSIGSNAATIKHTNNVDIPHPVLDIKTPFKEYKKTYDDKDVMYYFKDMYYTPQTNNTTYYFLADYDKNERLEIGKRTNATLFAVNIGKVPDLIHKLKAFIYENLSHLNYYCIKLHKLKDNKEHLRLLSMIDSHYLLLKTENGYKLVNDTQEIIYPIGHRFPLIANILDGFSHIVDRYQNFNENNRSRLSIMDLLYDKKLKLSNTDKDVDVEDVVNASIQHQNVTGFKVNPLDSPVLEVGRDIPNYNTLKQIEKDVKDVNLMVDIDNYECLARFYVEFVFEDRVLLTCNYYRQRMLLHAKTDKTSS